jgi:tmRNA-binding protein
MIAKAKTTRLPSITWREAEPTSTGNQCLESRDGMFRLIHSTQIDGIPLMPLWVLWRWRGGLWRKVAEARGRARVEKRARLIQAEYDSEE